VRATWDDRGVRVPDDLLVHLRRARDLADRHYAEPLDLDGLAAVAGVSKYHFLRCFAATYGRTPALYLAERRIERAQDLLRTSNLTVTEVCFLVGYGSLGSFSSRFRQLVGESPSAYQARWSAAGAPRIPGCYVFMHGLSDRRPAAADPAIPEKQAAAHRP
jgi:AraC-like DNA-binding protein